MSLFSGMNLFADISSNHRGDKNVFLSLCHEVLVAGAVPKVQLFNEATFPRAWAQLMDFKFVPSVFRPADVDFIMPFKPLALKIASVESTHWELIGRCMEENLPLIISTGGMNEEELEMLLEFAGGHPELCLMHCVSLYPTPREQINLGRLARLSEDFEGTVGWSSHYPVVDAAAFALAWAWGATQFEVHVRPAYDRGPESKWVKTLDEQCAFTPLGLGFIREILESLPTLEGSEDYTGPDRDFVVKHRARWEG